MPLYDYRCVDCGTDVEVRHGIHGSGPETCAVCGGVMRKAVSTPAIHFRGSGWAKKDAQTAASRTQAAKAGGDQKDGAGSEPDGAGSSGSDGSKADGAKADGGAAKTTTGAGSTRDASGGSGATTKASSPSTTPE